MLDRRLEDGTASVVWKVEDFPVEDRAEIEESLRTHGAAMVLRVGASHEPNMVWVPAVPLPLIGMLVDTCRSGGGCRARFFGRDRRRKHELHWRTEHGPFAREGHPQVEMTRAEAEKTLAAVAAQDWRLLP